MQRAPLLHRPGGISQVGCVGIVSEELGMAGWAREEREDEGEGLGAWGRLMGITRGLLTVQR